MATAYGRRYRRRVRSTRRFRRRAAYKRPHRRVYRRRRSTTSSTVKLTLESTWTLNDGASTPGWNPFAFSPLSLPGFSDYQLTYSHFRILKAKLYVSRTIGTNDGSLYNYLVVGSRPFAATNATTPGDYSTLVPSQKEDALRQTKWQRVRYPSTTNQKVSVGFYPYTMIGTYGPAAVGSQSLWYRIWEAKKWMPFSWAAVTGITPGSAVGIRFFGPFLVVDTNTGKLPANPQVQCTLQLHVQFRGQR